MYNNTCSKQIKRLPRNYSNLRQQEQALQSYYRSRVSSQNPRSYLVRRNFSFLTNYKISVAQEIGRGGYGVVYRGQSTSDQDNKKQLAIKLNYSTISKEIITLQIAFLILIRNLQRLPRLFKFINYNYQTAIVTQYFEHVPFIKLFYKLPLDGVKHYILELLIGLKNLKDAGIYHRDLKPRNYLYNPDTKRGVIIDFGLAQLDTHFQRQVAEDKTQKRKALMQEHKLTIKLHKIIDAGLDLVGRRKFGTTEFMPIETLLHHQKQNYQSDIWPVGIILLSFVLRKKHIFNQIQVNNRKQPYYQYYQDIQPKNAFLMQYLIQVARFLGTQPVVNQCRKLGIQVAFPEGIEKVNMSELARLHGYNPELQDLLFKLLEIDVDKRIKVQDAIRHSFFNSIRSEHSFKRV